MDTLVLQFAAVEAEGESKSLFGALGVDWRLLLLQLVAFAILVYLLGKYVYPRLIEAIDKREAAIADSVAAAQKAEAKAEASQHEVENLLAQARTEASDIVDAAHKESAAMVKDAEAKAKNRADQIVTETRSQLEQDVIKARQQLRSETADLVALATEKIVREKVDASRDKTLIDSAIKEAR